MKRYKLNGLLLLITACVILASCATKKDTDFLEFSSEDVENSLKIDDKKLEKFKLKKSTKVEIKNSSQQKSSLKYKGKKKEKSRIGEAQSLSKEDSREAPSAGIQKSKLSLKKETPVRIKYPEGYPEEFKKYDLKSAPAWNSFQPTIYLGEKHTFKVSYLGITAGFIKMETLPKVNLGDTEVFHLKAKMRSARYYKYIYSLDDSIESFVTTSNFLPLKYILLQRESAQKVDDLQLFDHSELKTYHFYKRLKRGKRKEVELEKPIPHFFQDSFSALYFVRGFPLKKGDRYEFPIVTRGKIWILKILVEGKEEIEVGDKTFQAIKINAETRFPGVLEKKGDILFWYSADKIRKLLKFEAQVKIGSVEGELIEYIPGESF